jgi:hypothetical protein
VHEEKPSVEGGMTLGYRPGFAPTGTAISLRFENTESELARMCETAHWLLSTAATVV